MQKPVSSGTTFREGEPSTPPPRPPQILLTAIAIVLLGGIVTLDAFVEPEISLSVLYILPVVIASWHGDRLAGIVISLLGSVLWLAIDWSEQSYRLRWTPYWEAVTRAAIYIVVALVIGRLRQSIRNEKRQAAVIRALNASLERRVEARTHELKKTLGDLEGFTYAMAHILRAPLRAVHGFSEILRQEHDNALNAAGREYLDRIGEAARRMDRLVLDLLEFAHLIHDPVETGDVDAEALVRTIGSSLEETLKPCRVDLRLEGSIPHVLGENRLLTEVLRQLLGNAIVGAGDGRERRIRIRAERHAQWVRILVEDNGPDIPPQQRDRVFEPGEQALPGDLTGMGLAIMRKAVERMDGHVGVESPPQGGRRFWFELRAA
jgi:signal transduction histidine kinase